MINCICVHAPSCDKMATESLSDAWFLIRKLTVSASKLGVSINLYSGDICESQFRSIRHGYKEIFSKDTQGFLKWGQDHEEEGAYAVEVVFGVKCIESPFVLDPDIPNFGATPDKYVPHAANDNKPFLVEIKAPGRMYASPPPAYICQMYAQMRVYGVKRTYFSCWTPKQVKIWVVLFDDNFWRFIYRRLQVFIQCVQFDVPPNNLLPHIGYVMQEWAACDYNKHKLPQIIEKENRNRTNDRIYLQDIPPKPIYKLAYHVYGNFDRKKDIHEVEKVVYCDDNLVANKPPHNCTHMSEDDREFWDLFIKNSLYTPIPFSCEL